MRAGGEQTDSHVSIGVDAAVFLHILHLCWVNMLNLLNSLLGLARVREGKRTHSLLGRVRWWGGGCRTGVRTHLLLHRHLLGGASRLDRHGGLEWDSGGGVGACFRGLHGT